VGSSCFASLSRLCLPRWRARHSHCVATDAQGRRCYILRLRHIAILRESPGPAGCHHLSCRSSQYWLIIDFGDLLRIDPEARQAGVNIPCGLGRTAQAYVGLGASRSRTGTYRWGMPIRCVVAATDRIAYVPLPNGRGLWARSGQRFKGGPVWGTDWGTGLAPFVKNSQYQYVRQRAGRTSSPPYF
jgi:hypothetical protein